MFLSCTTHDSYTVASLDGSKCIMLEYNTSTIFNDSLFVQMYLGSGQINRDQYVKMLWSDIGSVDVDWESKPIKIRSWLLKENTMPSDVADARSVMSDVEKKDFHRAGPSWRSYDFTSISNDKYNTCE